MYFNNNTVADVYIAAASTLTIETGTDIKLLNGIRTAGGDNSEIIKTGTGELMFSEDSYSDIGNRFTVSEGKAVFESSSVVVKNDMEL